MHAKADFEVTAGGSCASSYKKTAPSRGMVSAPSCELKTCTPATCSAWASGHFSAQTVVAILLIIVGVTPTDKFAADATQLPTGCQPESLAKPARRRSHKPNAPIAVPEKKPHSGRGRGFFSISDMAECSFAKFHLNQKSHGPRGRERLNGETNSLKRRKTARHRGRRYVIPSSDQTDEVFGIHNGIRPPLPMSFPKIPSRVWIRIGGGKIV
jgi:hypothetical protein